jgi:membrane-bound lytic murein transglycosylase D
MILAAMIIAKNPSQYGFDITPVAATLTETVILPPSLDLRRVAEWAGVPMDDIQALNPEFRRWTTPVKKGEYTIKVPQGTADKVRDGLAAAEPGQLNAMQFHTVKRGETLATIAKKLKVNRTDLAEANYLKTSSKVAAGSRLIIPRMPSAALLARASSGELEKTAETIASDVLAGTAEETKSAVTPSRARTYKVRPGDTLSAIARKTGTTITQLKNWNKLRTTHLRVGTQLLVQSPKAVSTQ